MTVFGMMNIGTNPTVEGKEQSIEVHYLNFDADLYNKKIAFKMVNAIRYDNNIG